MNKALIGEDGILRAIKPEAESEPGAVRVPWYSKDGDRSLDGGTSIQRWDGQEWTAVADPGYPIPVGELFRELNDTELASVLRIVFPTLADAHVGVLVFLFRCVAQTELSSIDPRVIAARTAFGPLLGADRIAHLFRQR